MHRQLPHFKVCPILRSLELFSCNHMEVKCSDDSYTSSTSYLKERILVQGFRLIGNLLFSGSGEDIRYMFAWLPEFPGVGQITIELSGGTQVQFLDRAPSVFSGTVTLFVKGVDGVSDLWGFDVGVFEALAAWSSVSAANAHNSRARAAVCQHGKLAAHEISVVREGGRSCGRGADSGTGP